MREGMDWHVSGHKHKVGFILHRLLKSFWSDRHRNAYQLFLDFIKEIIVFYSIECALLAFYRMVLAR